MERIAVSSSFGTTPPPISKRLRKVMGEEEAERRIKEVLANDGALVLAWAQEKLQDPSNSHHLCDKTFHLDDLPEAMRPNVMRLMAMRFLESREEVKT